MKLISSVVLLVGIVAIILKTVPAFSCSNTMVDEKLMPKGPYRATVFLRDCKRKKTSIHVSLMKLFYLSNRDKGNVFIAEGCSKENPGVSTRWINNRELEITYDSHLSVLKSENEIYSTDIKVSYVKKEDAPEH